MPSKGEGCAMPKKLFKAVYALNFIFQAAFSMIIPAGLLILGGWYLNSRCGWGRWVLITAIVLGVVFGFYSMIYYIVKTKDYIDPTEHKGEDNGTSK